MKKSKLKHIKNIKKRNVVFNKMSDEEKRIEIALDMLSLLEAGIMTSSNGLYWGVGLNSKFNSDNYKNAKKFQEDLNNIENINCSVCARGGLMLSQIRLGNSIEPSDEFKSKGSKDNIKGFNLATFQDIEILYENFQPDNCTWVKLHPYEKHSTKRLKNICHNIINNGDFVKDDYTDYLN